MMEELNSFCKTINTEKENYNSKYKIIPHDLCKN